MLVPFGLNGPYTVEKSVQVNKLISSNIQIATHEEELSIKLKISYYPGLKLDTKYQIIVRDEKINSSGPTGVYDPGHSKTTN